MKALICVIALISIFQSALAETAISPATESAVKNQCLVQITAAVGTVSMNKEIVAEARRSKKQSALPQKYVFNQETDKKLDELWKKFEPVATKMKKTGIKTPADEKVVAEVQTAAELILKNEGGTTLQDCAAVTLAILSETTKACPGFEKMDQAGAEAKACLDKAREKPAVVAAIKQWAKFMGKAEALIKKPE